jgi:hypothetical protein
LENWDQFKTVEEDAFTEWDRFAPAETETGTDLSSGMSAIRAQDSKKTSDKLAVEDAAAIDAAKKANANHVKINNDLKAVAQRAGNSFSAELERDVANYKKEQEASLPESRLIRDKTNVDNAGFRKPESLGEWILQFTDSFVRQVESELEETRRERAEGIWKGREDRSQFGAAFQRGGMGAIEMLGAGLRGYGETIERQTGETEGSTTLRRLGAAVQKGGAYGRTAAPEPKVGTLEEVNWNAKKFGDYVVEKIGEGLGSSSVFLTAGGLGGIPAAGATAITMGTGEVRSELEREGITDPELVDKYSYIGGTVVGLLDTVVPAKLMNALSSNARKEVGKYVFTRVTRATVKGMAAEGITEAMQEAISIASVAEAGGDQKALEYIRALEKKHGLDSPTNPQHGNERATRGLLAWEAVKKDWKRIAEAGAAGALPGGFMTGSGAVVQEGRSAVQGKETYAEPTPEETLADIQGIQEWAAEQRQSSQETGQTTGQTEARQTEQAKLPEADLQASDIASIQSWANEQYGPNARVFQFDNDVAIGVRQPDGSVDWKTAPGGVSVAELQELGYTASELAPTAEEAAPAAVKEEQVQQPAALETTGIEQIAETPIKPVPQEAEDVKPDVSRETRGTLKAKFDEYVAIADKIGAIPDDVQIPPELLEAAQKAENELVPIFREQGLPGIPLETAQDINSVEDILRAFDEATPEEVRAYWQQERVETATADVQAESKEITERKSQKTTFAKNVNETALRIYTEPFGDRVPIAQIYDEYGKVYPDAGSLSSFKDRLIEAAKNRKIDLARADLPEMISQELRERSETKWNTDVVHYVKRRGRSGETQTGTRISPDTRKAFYDFIESKAPLKTEAIAKNLGVNEETISELAREAERAGWLKRGPNGKLRRAQAKKRPERPTEPVAQPENSKAMAITPTRLAGDEYVAKTKAAQKRYDDILAAVKSYAARTGIAPKNLEIKAVETIKVPEAKGKDQRLALQKEIAEKGFDYHEPNDSNFEVPGYRGEWKELSKGKDEEGNIQRRREYNLYKGNKLVASMKVRTATAGRAYVYDVEAPGLGEKFYNAVEKHFGSQLRPSNLLTEAGYKFWRKRDPSAVQWHQWSKTDEYYVSPRELLRRRQEGIEARETNILWNSLPLEAHVIAHRPDLMFALGSGKEGALGQTNSADLVISLGMRAIEMEAAAKDKTVSDEAIRVFRHEVMEFYKAFGDQIFKPREWKTLEAAARENGWVETTGVREAYTQLYQENMSEKELSDLILKEAIAEQFSEYVAGRKTFPKNITELFERVKQFLARVGNYVRGQGFQTWEDVFERIDRGEFRQRFEQAFPEVTRQEGVKGMQLPGAEAVAPDSIMPTPGPGVSLPEMSLTDIRDSIVDVLGLNVRRSRLDPALKRAAKEQGQVLQGQYNVETDIIRVQEMNDVETLFHEAGHQQINQSFRDRFGVALTGAMTVNEVELRALDPSGRADLEEGFADFFRRYLTNYKMAQARAPEFYRQFEDIVGGINPDLLAQFKETQRRVEEYQNASSAGRLASSTKSTVRVGSLAAVKQDLLKYGVYTPMKWIKDVHGYLQKVYHARVSDINWVHKWVIEVAENAERNNKHLDFSFWKNPSKQAQQLNNAYTAGFADLTQGIHFIGVNRKGSTSLYDGLVKAFGGQERAQWTDEMLNAFGTYLLARRGRWLWMRFQPDPNAKIEGEFSTPPTGTFVNGQWYVDKALNQTRIWINGKWEGELTHAPDKNSRADHEEAITSFEREHPQFAEAAQLVYKFLYDWTLKEHQANILTDEEFDFRMKTSDYVPWFRVMDQDQAYLGGAVKRKTPKQHALHGSYRDFINPIEGIARMVYEGNYNIRVNNMKRTMQEIAMSSGVGYGHLAEPIDPTQARGTKINLFDAMMNEARKRGVTDEDASTLLKSVVGYIGDNGNTTVFKRGEINERGEQVIYYLRKGEINAFVLANNDVGKGVFHFFQTLGEAPDLDGLVSILSYPGRMMQTAVTAHPRFQVWNFIRDQFSAAAMVPGYIPLVSNVKTAINNWYERRQESGTSWDEIIASHAGIMGGMNSAAQMQMRQNRDVKALRRKKITWKPMKLDFWTRTVFPGSKEFWRWKEFTEASTRQTVARIEYKHALKELGELYPGMPREQLEFIALEEAVFKSSNYVPYNRGGAKMQFLRQTIRFMNAGIQAEDRNFKVALAAEMESGQWSTPRIIKKGTKTLASMVMPWLKHSRGEPLTRMEKKALGRAFYYWSVVVTIAAACNIFRAMGDDDDEALKEEITDYQDSTYIHFTLPFTDDVVGFFPRGFDLMGVTSNAMSAAYDAEWRKDPTAKERFVESAYRMLIPAHSVSGLDVYSGLFENYNRFTERPIVPNYMKKGYLPQDQYHGWIDPISLELGKQLEISPHQVSYAMTALGAQYANDLKTIAVAANPNREALNWWEYPIVSSFFRDPSKFSRSKQKYYDTVVEYTQFNGSYKKRIDSGDTAELKRFLENADPNIKAYLIAKNHFDAEQRRLHPLVRVQKISQTISSLMKDIILDRLPQPNAKAGSTNYVVLSPTRKRDAFDILRGLEMRELRRTLILMDVPGWAQKRDDLLKPDKFYNQMQQIVPEVWAIYKERTHSKRKGHQPWVYDYDTVKAKWPSVRSKLLDNNVLSDIVANRGDVEFNFLLQETIEAKAASK